MGGVNEDCKVKWVSECWGKNDVLGSTEGVMTERGVRPSSYDDDHQSPFTVKPETSQNMQGVS